MDKPTVKILAQAEWHATPEAPRPDVSFVPPMERRRLTGVERAAISVARKVYPEGEEVPVVFASRWGEIGITAKLMRQCHDDGEMSPAGFSAKQFHAKNTAAVATAAQIIIRFIVVSKILRNLVFFEDCFSCCDSFFIA